MSTEESYPALLALAVHELRTPANVLGGYLRMLQQDDNPPLAGRQRKMVDEAGKSFTQLADLISQLNDIAGFDAGVVTMAQHRIDLFLVVRKAAEAAHEPRPHDRQVAVRGLETGAAMTGDLDRLHAAFRAVFRAVLREAPEPCTVVADRRLAREGSTGSAVIVVADAERVQAAYDAPPGAFDDTRGGLGLGLPMARRVIEAHGGRLWAPADGHRLSRAAALMAFPLSLET